MMAAVCGKTSETKHSSKKFWGIALNLSSIKTVLIFEKRKKN